MTTNGQQSININITQLLIAMVASMAIICAFIAYMTNVLVTSKVNALDDIKNPVTTTAPAQSNVAGGLCTDPSITAAAPAPGDVLGLGGPIGSPLATLRGGSVSLTYNQSNTSTTNTSNTSTNVDSRFSGNSISMFNGNALNSNNSSSVSSNTTTNTTNNTTNTNIQTWDNNNNNGNSSTNTSNNTTNTNTTVNTDNSNNSTNTAVIVPIIL